jgi:hypothetical protein
MGGDNDSSGRLALALVAKTQDDLAQMSRATRDNLQAIASSNERRHLQLDKLTRQIYSLVYAQRGDTALLRERMENFKEFIGREVGDKANQEAVNNLAKKVEDMSTSRTALVTNILTWLVIAVLSAVLLGKSAFGGETHTDDQEQKTEESP